MHKQMDNSMETGVIQRLIGFVLKHYPMYGS